MAHKLSDLASPADSKSYKVAKSSGSPKLNAAGAAPAETKRYKFVKASGDTPTAASGVDISKKHSAKPNTSSRRR